MEKNSRLQRSLHDPNEFTLTFELVPSRGGRGKQHSRALAFARQAAMDGRLQAVSITENAGGHSALSPEVLGVEIDQMGLDVLVHFSCKDKNRNQMESLLFAWDRLGLRNLLVLSGDYPKDGYCGLPKPVFDLDSVQALDLINRLNQGRFRTGPHSRLTADPTSFYNGVVVSPFKHLEAELMMQYAKLHRKVAAGARFVITQVGFDPRKFQEVRLYMQQQDLRLPLLGNVFIPNLAVVELMHRGLIPGCVIPDPLYRQIRDEARSPDQGKRARLLRAAKLLAVLKGLGYNGAHVGGPALSFADLELVMDQALNFEKNWQEYLTELACWPADAFYFFEKDATTGLNRPQAAEPTAAKRPASIGYPVANLIHNLAFRPQGPLFTPGRKICQALDRPGLASGLERFEYFCKFLAFGCRNCGDCTLAELTFLCPQSGCAKYLLNGPCGGSRDGWCEVYPGRKKCLYVKLYARLRAAGRSAEAREGFVPPRDWALNNTSSWLNFYRGRDHAGRQEEPDATPAQRPNSRE